MLACPGAERHPSGAAPVPLRCVPGTSRVQDPFRTRRYVSGITAGESSDGAPAGRAPRSPDRYHERVSAEEPAPPPAADLDLRLVRYFTVVAARRHFGRAAADLMIAQPSLSRQIRHLEQQLGI